jgi:GNAT superfamily N-acetyltransferase
VEIREATAGDADRLADLVDQLGYEASPADVAARLASIAAGDDGVVLVAADAAGVAGWVHVREVAVLQAARFAELGGLVVASGRRGEGVGERLLVAAEAWATGRGLGEMRVRSNVVRKRAHSFYLRLGYSVEKTSVTFHRRL